MHHVTIIRPDNKVIIDGRVAKVDCSSMPNNYHAVQWHGAEGYIETRTGDNIILKDLQSFQALINQALLTEANARFAAEDEAAKPTLQRAQAAKLEEIDARMLMALGIGTLADAIRVLAAGTVDVQAVIAAADAQAAAVKSLATIAEVEAYEVPQIGVKAGRADEGPAGAAGGGQK